MATFTSHSPAETAALGEAWGREARPGSVFGLSGGLGAGKTCLAAALARGLGVSARVLSPTFALVHEYRDGRCPMFHLDLYRLSAAGDIIAAGLAPYLENPDGVAVVEWIERWLEGGPWKGGRGAKFRRVEIKSIGETEREIIYDDFGG
ncbi:MAG TPA: tRNA (adenosine(37)-N6)-threonylcarbamoyltransferase complex ATPase subunit type 1 TsaE [Verrucomicrobiae bacterium]|jgi:tRNA threonylcarbamoyladenosine biosynthesis protein TsaE